MPAIHEGGTAVRNANRLIEAAKLFDIPRLFTEQNAKGLGATVEDVPVEKDRLVHKQFFDACREDRFLEHNYVLRWPYQPAWTSPWIGPMCGASNKAPRRAGYKP
jgi:hypothetical protein